MDNAFPAKSVSTFPNGHYLIAWHWQYENKANGFKRLADWIREKNTECEYCGRKRIPSGCCNVCAVKIEEAESRIASLDPMQSFGLADQWSFCDVDDDAFKLTDQGKSEKYRRERLSVAGPDCRGHFR